MLLPLLYGMLHGERGCERYVLSAHTMAAWCRVQHVSLLIGSCFFLIFMLLFAILLILASLAVWAWWVADLVIFATNQRLAGSGCELMSNL